eukprot:scaffold15996_cov64-Phaeocystis_antarctica.AAC.1
MNQQIGSEPAAALCCTRWFRWTVARAAARRAATLRRQPSRLFGSAPSAPGEPTAWVSTLNSCASTAPSAPGPSVLGLARCGGWHGLATCDGSTARSPRRKRARPRAARPGAAIGGSMATPASLLCLPMAMDVAARGRTV